MCHKSHANIFGNAFEMKLDDEKKININFYLRCEGKCQENKYCVSSCGDELYNSTPKRAESI
ncbi:CLUMA_CG016113, isoform A [Clunio marinus]|uniref:CLUMA_CG016113, isoform A n=1 Tax=Clunio marinus TaxID=568069 RepID=A0A1J1IQU7_9DIPT|nr:CLUMA_CG016113, isoform A [Clunio marinus]